MFLVFVYARFLAKFFTFGDSQLVVSGLCSPYIEKVCPPSRPECLGKYLGIILVFVFSHRCLEFK